MDRGQLTALHAAIGAVLAWPDNIRAQIVQWLTAPEASRPSDRPNGRDPHPPPLASPSVEVPRRNISSGNGSEAEDSPPRRSPTPYAGKVRRGRPPISAKAAEQRLLTALQEHSGASVNVLAKAAGANRSSTGERLRQLARDGTIAKDAGGHWRLTADLAGEEPRPPAAPPSS